LAIKPENRFWIYIYSFTAFILLVAMAVFGWLVWTSKEEPGVGRVAGPRPATVDANALSDDDYTLLAQFQAPAVTPAPGAPTGFAAAMSLYEKQDYPDAASALHAVTQANPQFVPAEFYLGVSLLLSGSRISGIQELRDLTATGTPGAAAYQERARFYLAKGLIAEHDARRAQEQLQSVIALHGPLEKSAAALLARIQPAS
jgi:TolA-binding protein